MFLILATVYSAAIPLGEGPDEPGHADYAFFLARAWRLPVQRLDTRQADVPGEGHQPPLAYALAAPLALWLPQNERRTDTIGNPRFVWSGGAEPNAISHGSREYPPWQASVLAWHLMRLVSVVCGAATVLFTYLAAQELDPRFMNRSCGPQSKIKQQTSKIPLLAAGLVAFNPQFLFVAALVTNDALLTALSAALLWLIVRNAEQREGRTAEEAQRSQFYLLRQSIVLGVVLGLALLTKQSATIFVPVAMLAVMARVMGERPKIALAETTAAIAEPTWRAWFRRLLTRSSVHRLGLLHIVLVIGVVALAAGWWYMRNQQLYGDLFGLAAFRGEFATQPFQLGSPAAWTTALGQLHASFWARFGWMNVAPRGWVLWLYGALELVALAGLVRAGVLVWRARRPASVLSRFEGVVGHWSLVAIPVLALAWISSFAVTAGLVAWQGRLLFPALPALAILLARGLMAWGEPRIENRERSVASCHLSVAERNVLGITPDGLSTRHNTQYALCHTLAVAFVLCSLLLLAVWMPEYVIRSAYPPQTLPETVALARAENAVLFRFRRRGERSITLRGWRLNGPARPGATLDLTLTWYASARQVRDWVVFVHLVDDKGQVVAEDNRQPRDGAFPTTQWNIGDWIEDRHQIQLPTGLSGGTYTLRIGLYDSRNKQRAEVRIDEARPIGDALDLGSIIVGGEVKNRLATRVPAASPAICRMSCNA
jgi:4-amino-4-deoxy-L-arabinose transferase-like glycosyltransferase